MARWFEELETDGVAVVAQAFAISNASIGAEISGKRFKRNLVVAVPTAYGEDTGAASADVFREGGFHARQLLVTRDVDGNGHRNSFLDARCGKGLLHAVPPTSELKNRLQTGRDTRKPKDPAPTPHPEQVAAAATRQPLTRE